MKAPLLTLRTGDLLTGIWWLEIPESTPELPDGGRWYASVILDDATSKRDGVPVWRVHDKLETVAPWKGGLFLPECIWDNERARTATAAQIREWVDQRQAQLRQRFAGSRAGSLTITSDVRGWGECLAWRPHQIPPWFWIRIIEGDPNVIAAKAHEKA